MDGILYGDIRVELTEPFTPEEEAEFKDWAVGQIKDDMELTDIIDEQAQLQRSTHPERNR